MIPWRLILRFTALQALVVTGILVIGARASAKEIFFSLLLVVPASIWFGRALYAPLVRLVKRAQSGATSHDPDSIGELADHEWADLESALTRIQTDLQGKEEQMSREREELSAIMASISDAILAIDRDAKLLFYNPKFSEFFGTHPLGPQAPRITDVLRTPEVIEIFQECLRTGERRAGAAQLTTRTHVQPLHFSISATPLRKQSGEVDGVVCAFHDVTELKRSERVRIDFVANVSHELRTPLTSIRGYTSTLIEDSKTGRWDAAPQFLEVIGRNVDRLFALVEDLLDLSSLESGLTLNKSQLETRELTERVLQQLEPKIRAKKLQTTIEYSAEHVCADPRRIEQVLVNLIDNAAKYTPEGGLIQVRWRQSNKESVLLEVEDNGPGIPPDALPRVFERFYRVDVARSREVGGTGLGLAIVKHIVSRHGGSVAVESTVGMGSLFRCVFPNG
jgi:two-component system phosphate regulon sensor histidine kinase PhoR